MFKPNLRLVLIYVLYFVGFEKKAVRQAMAWEEAHKLPPAVHDFFLWQDAYASCRYCQWPILPEDSHAYCSEMMQLDCDLDQLEADIKTEEADNRAFLAEVDEELRQFDKDEAEHQVFLADNAAFEADMAAVRLAEYDGDEHLRHPGDDSVADATIIAGYAAFCAEQNRQLLAKMVASKPSIDQFMAEQAAPDLG
jgi:hypothetical protein